MGSPRNPHPLAKEVIFCRDNSPETQDRALIMSNFLGTSVEYSVALSRGGVLQGVLKQEVFGML